MVRHRRDDTHVEPVAEVDPADEAEHTALETPMPGEADPVDATEQAEPLALDDELRAEPPACRPTRPRMPSNHSCGLPNQDLP
ncbi:hypothetical protein [Haloactinomyces albus]|uniref:Uncharacterized protein n=1 Tax=Haloactinomyces albus TaxID=1352928 RepID=A0AAE4CS99_9ACTN|nr:hypothetical protein [Haloactinomyces albus]MDR7304468.1 hypothetical protein [Haloactinomyces albus]